MLRLLKLHTTKLMHLKSFFSCQHGKEFRDMKKALKRKTPINSNPGPPGFHSHARSMSCRPGPQMSPKVPPKWCPRRAQKAPKPFVFMVFSPSWPPKMGPILGPISGRFWGPSPGRRQPDPARMAPYIS